MRSVCKPIFLSLVLLLFGGSVAYSGNVGLCTADEQVVFSCTTEKKGKIISVCTAGNLSDGTGYLQYRFGKPGNVELEYPKNRKNSQKAFKYYNYGRSQVSISSLQFKIGKVKYKVFSDFSDEDEEIISEKGVRVNLPDGREISIYCMPQIDRLWRVEDLVPRSEEE